MARASLTRSHQPLFNIALRGVQMPRNKLAYNERINGSQALQQSCFG